jgi:uncharacterized membrane protein HdeD (DUF308 family)
LHKRGRLRKLALLLPSEGGRVLLGIVLIVIGVLFILLSLVAAARTVLRGSSQTTPGPAGLGPFDPEKWAKLVEAVTNFLKVAPGWLVLTLVGAALVAWGGSML